MLIFIEDFTRVYGTLSHVQEIFHRSLPLMLEGNRDKQGTCTEVTTAGS